MKIQKILFFLNSILLIFSLQPLEIAISRIEIGRGITQSNYY